MLKFFETIWEMDLICDYDGHITRTLSSFDISLIQVINICDTFPGKTCLLPQFPDEVSLKQAKLLVPK